MTGWDVRVEGRPDCKHEPEHTTLPSDPPISQVRCVKCGRTLWRRHSANPLPWPEGDETWSTVDRSRVLRILAEKAP